MAGRNLFSSEDAQNQTRLAKIKAPQYTAKVPLHPMCEKICEYRNKRPNLQAATCAKGERGRCMRAVLDFKKKKIQTTWGKVLW